MHRIIIHNDMDRRDVNVCREREQPEETQAVIDAIPPYPVAESPSGRGKVETYTVMHAGANPALITVVGSMVSGEDAGKRFIANMSLDVAQDLVSMKLDLNDMEGSVATDEDGKCSFALDGAAAKL